MKFVSLALALLLAVGSHAAAMPQADAPSPLAHIRAGLDMALTSAREGAKRSLGHLDDAEFGELKQRGIAKIDEIYNRIKELQGSVSHVTDSFVSTVADATAPMRESIRADTESLGAELEPLRETLREVVSRHLQGYRAELEPIVNEMQAKHQAEMEALRVRMEPVLAQLSTQFSTNFEETKEAMIPILAAVRAKLVERMEITKRQVGPYYEEYKQQIEAIVQRMRNQDPALKTQLMERLTPIGMEIKEKIQEAATIMMATFQQA